MPAPIGNKNAEGHDGTNAGRKSAYQENSDAQFLNDLWEGKFSEEELTKIIASKKYGAKHVFAVMALTRDPKMMAKLVDKLFANKQKVEVENTNEKEVKEYFEKLNKAINDAKTTTTKVDGETEEFEPVSC